jgi:hypothetical protein
VTTREFLDADETEEARAPELPSDQELTWTAFKGKFAINSGARVKVYRQTPKGRQYCFYGSPSEIDEESIRIFHCKQPYAHEQGDYILALEVDGQLQEPFSVPIAPQVSTPGTETTVGSSGGMAEVLRMIQAQNERLERLMLEQNRTPMVEMIDAMSKLDQMRNAGGGGGLGNVETLMKAIDIGRNLNAPEAQDWQTMLMSTLKEAAPVLLPMLSRIAAKPEAPKPQTLEQVPTEVQPVQLDDTEKQAVRGMLAYLKKKAMAGSDPLLYIDLVVDNAEEQPYARLISEIVNNDFSAFTAIDPELAQPQYVHFFRTIHDGIRSVFTPKGPVAVSTAGKSGDKANASGNGTTGKGGGK